MKTIVNIEQKRNELRMSQEQLAKKVGVCQGMISMIERGERTPSLGVLVKLAAALGCTIDDLIDRKEAAP